MLTATLFAVAFIAAPPAEAPHHRYALDLSVTRHGVTTVSTRSVIVEDGDAHITIVDSERVFEMNANLAPVQGDGEGERLFLSLSIVDGEAEPVEPRLLFNRGGTARVEIGEQDQTGRMIDGLTVDIRPDEPVEPAASSAD